MRKLKKWLLLVVILIIVICLFLLLYGGNDSDKLLKLGYKENEIKMILKMVPKNGYSYFSKKYDDSLIDLISSKEYKKDNFEKYISYYEKNSKSKISDIVTIVNSGYDLMDYPASSLLADLVLEKYYIHSNVARYLDYGNSHDVKSKKVVSIVNADADMEFYSKTNESKLSDNNLILVNKYNYLPDGYEPNDLVILTSKYNSGRNSSMRKEAADAFMKMADGAMLDGVTLKNASAYRSYDYQVNLYNNYVTRDGKEKADIYSARAGYSEHQTGLCTDINTIDSSFDNTSASKWLKDNAYKYGFILRFPKDKEDVTGYKYESWHYRYVGEKVAKIIYDEDLTLEEYYAFYVMKH